MPTMEVRRLVAQFESNRKEITILQTKLDKLQRDYRNVWNKIRTECEKGSHDQTDVKSTVFWSQHKCPYCRKQLFPVTFACNAWDPEGIFKEDYCDYWLNINENDWPVDKRKMLRRIKSIVSEYFAAVKPVVASLASLREEQKDIKQKLHEIFKLCDSVLGITAEYEETMRGYMRANRKAPPFNDPDAFRD